MKSSKGRFAGYMTWASKIRGLVRKHEKVPLKWPSEGPAWGTCFLQPVAGIMVRVRVFDVIFTSRMPEGPERCPAEGG